jgi:ABC-type molybdate transport system substrate-binding protein
MAVAPSAPATHGDVVVFAAGSLRAPLTDVAKAFEERSGRSVALTFGPSGLLRDRIGSGEAADVFASANTEPPRGLAAFGWAHGVERFARNAMCVLAAPWIDVSSHNVLAVLLDPAVSVGTSTPKADPSGDYAWEVFRKAEAIEAGALATLTTKARQLTGGPHSPQPPDRNVYAMLVAEAAVDVFVTYRTNAALARQERPALQIVELPRALAVGADYGMAVRRDAAPTARDFASFVLAREGQGVLAAYGFDPP